jgi:hypothetical protein
VGNGYRTTPVKPIEKLTMFYNLKPLASRHAFTHWSIQSRVATEIHEKTSADLMISSKNGISAARSPVLFLCQMNVGIIKILFFLVSRIFHALHK